MRRVDIREFSQKAAALLGEKGDEPVVLTQHGKPIAVVFPTPNVDWETVALSLDKEFIALLERSRRLCPPGQGIPSEVVRKELGLDDKRGLPPFEEVWQRVRKYQGEEFAQIRGARFTYACLDGFLIPDHTRQRIPQTHFEKAYRYVPLENTVPVQHLRGPSYIYAILMDPRIRQTDW